MGRLRWVVAAGVALAAAAPLPAQTAMPWDPAVPGTLSWVAGRESVRMVACILRGGPMGVGQGWFAPGQSVYGWKWLAARYDADHDGVVTRAEFTGPAALFDRLDRDHDGRLTPADFDFSPRPPARQPSRPSGPPQEGPPKMLLLHGLAVGEIGSWHEGPAPGEPAPHIRLAREDGKGVLDLDEYRGRLPAVLVFGSFT
jgi:hypothetical protein